MKKVLSLILSLCLILSLFTAVAITASADSSDLIAIKSYAGADATQVNIVNGLTSSTQRFSNKVWDFSSALPEEIAGADYVQLPYEITSEEQSTYFSNAGTPWLTLTIKHSVSLYFLTASDLADSNCQSYLNSWGGEWIKDENNAKILWRVNSESNWAKRNVYLYKLDIDLHDGEVTDFILPTAGKNATGVYCTLAFVEKENASTPIGIKSYAGSDSSQIKIVDELVSTTKRFSDHNCDFSTAVPEEIAGATYVQMPYNLSSEDSAAYFSNNYTPWLTLNINHSGTLYYITASDYVANSCQKYLQTMGGSWVSDDQGNHKKVAINAEGGNGSRKWVYLYKIEYDLFDNETSEFVLPTAGSGASGYICTLAFVEKENLYSPISVKSYAGSDSSQVKIVPELVSTTKRFSDHNCDFSTAVPEEIAGAAYVQMPYNLSSEDSAAYFSNNYTPWLTLNINHSGTLYYITASDYVANSCQKYLQTMGGSWVSDDQGNHKKVAVNAEGGNGSRKWVYLYKIEFDMEDGETAEFVLPTAGSGASGYVCTLAFVEKSNVNPIVSVKSYAGENASNIRIIPDMNSSVVRFSDESDDFSSAFPTELSGAWYVQMPKNLSASEKSVCYNSTYTTWITLTLTESAEMYYITPSTYVADSGQVFLQNWYGDWVRDAQTNEPVLWVVNSSSNWTKKNVYLYKQYIYVPEGETVDIAVPTLGPSFENAMYTFAFKPVDLYDVNISLNENGYSSKQGDVGVLPGENISFDVIPDDGYYISYISIDGLNVYENETSGISVEFQVDSNRTVVICFAPKALPASITPYNGVFTTRELFDDASGNPSLMPSAVVFATAEGKYGDYERAEFGMLLSGTSLPLLDFTTSNASLVKAEATELPTTSGHYGMRFYGSWILSGNTYYAVPYAIYENSLGNSVTLYGSGIISFTPDN